MKTERFYTVKTLAERLAVQPLTIYRLVQSKGRSRRSGSGGRYGLIQKRLMPSSIRSGSGLVD